MPRTEARASSPAPSARSALAPRLLAGALLAVAVLVAFWPVLDADFINHDDDRYVTKNPIVQQGLTVETVRWAWTASEMANWHPLTWIAHMLDWQLYGPAPAGHHATSLVLHLVNTLLLFRLLDGMTGAVWRSALAAGLFGLHPLHVESVAWVSERKDVLSTCFWFLTTLAWVAWVRRPRVGRYLLVVVSLALGLMAKPMLVTLPLTLLLLDFWPLGRLAAGGRAAWRLVREKLPLLSLVAASSVLTVVMQGQGDAVASFEAFPFTGRVENAIVSYVTYLGKTLWPRGLALPYPHPGGHPAWQVGTCALLLALMTAAAVRLRAQRPYLLVGWLWYLGTLVPVIGLVQVGAQALADRYTYVPLVGIFIAAAWALPVAPAPRFVAAAALAVLLTLGVLTRVQVLHWRDSLTLFSHTLRVEEQNPVAHTLLGLALADQDETEPAIAHFERAIVLRPEFPVAHIGLGSALFTLGRPDDAIDHYAVALAVDPSSVDALNNLGSVLLSQGRVDEAIVHYQRALALAPASSVLHGNLGMALRRQGRMDEALEQLELAIAADPRNVRALEVLGGTLIMMGRAAEGLVPLEQALALSPDFGRAHASRAGGLFTLGRYAEAWAAVRAARSHGVEPPQTLLQMLAGKMPEPVP